MTPVREFDFAKGRTAARAGACAWLLLIGWPLWAFMERGPEPLAVIAALGGVAVFAACWVAIMWRMLSSRATTSNPWAVAGLAGSGLALLPLFGPPWAYTSFVYAVSAFAATLPTGAFAAATAATAAVEVTALLVSGAPPAQVWWVPLVIAAQAGAVHSLRHMGLLVARLDAARAEVARLAVENERLRFARDLHDTLGHTLTSITIRSQLAARLAPADPGRAAAEMTEVEGAARRALDEVRRTITGYRAPSLSEELEGASRNLGVAGIEVTVSPADGPIPAAAEALLAWSVREAATNVLRHSRARHCRIALRLDETSAALEVVDDGHPAPATAPGDHGHQTAAARTPPGDDDLATAVGDGDGVPARRGARAGSGLAGLAERVGAAGGRLEAGPRPEGGYLLRVRVPLEAHQADVARVDTTQANPTPTNAAQANAAQANATQANATQANATRAGGP
ncbi:two-component system sensor histidine kinase DesK [Nonomuraea fuscirosea]|uniref:Two-component system sensor histidine kinase DesK n=1 Tax=Nonomuraea fuscirosea TaxID=1291556 RepID=A0A2T0N4X7_9ACTN|nr:sensor histidine kinase [Nonomuraea fuscirosea]PRX67400.1 two-component system sensor histidine kinase DesK [Nonomuraea fuscirosea]